MNTAPTRPVMRYHGGKWKIAWWLIALFPKHRIYVEPYGGAASVLMQKPRSYAEIYNDLDDEIVNVFRVLRDDRKAAELRRLLELTPYAREELYTAYRRTEDPVEQARRTIVRSFLGFSSASATRDHATGFRSSSSRSGTTPAVDWSRWPSHLEELTARIKGVTIENTDALAVIAQHDNPDTLYYVDPPYVHSTRKRPRGALNVRCYKHEMSDGEHRALSMVLHAVKGMVVLSGYDCPLYDELYPDWQTRTLETFGGAASGAAPRQEKVWMNATAAARSPRQHNLFSDS